MTESRSDRLARVPHARAAWWGLLAVSSLLFLGGGYTFLQGTMRGNGGAQGFGLLIAIWGIAGLAIVYGSRSVVRRPDRGLPR
jgi:hypothetical protein